MIRFLSCGQPVPLGCDLKITSQPWGAWVAQLVKRPTLDFGSGHDLVVCEFEPHVGHCADTVTVQSLPRILSLSPSLWPSCVCTLNKQTNLKNYFSVPLERRESYRELGLGISFTTHWRLEGAGVGYFSFSLWKTVEVYSWVFAFSWSVRLW